MNRKKLPKATKDKWVKALRSGKFEQGSGHLFEEGDYDTSDTYCCLGVACKIGIAHPRKNGEELCTKWFLNDDIQKDLATKNDSGNWSFKKIATWINKNL